MDKPTAIRIVEIDAEINTLHDLLDIGSDDMSIRMKQFINNTIKELIEEKQTLYDTQKLSTPHN